MDENIYEQEIDGQEITEDPITASGSLDVPEEADKEDAPGDETDGGKDAPEEEAPAEEAVKEDAPEKEAPAEDGAALAGIKLGNTLKSPPLRSSGVISVSCTNLYTIDGLNGDHYRVTFPAEGNSVCVRNDASDTIYLSLKPNAGTTEDEVIPLPQDGIVNDLYVPAALYITMGEASGDVVVMRR